MIEREKKSEAFTQHTKNNRKLFGSKEKVTSNDDSDFSTRLFNQVDEINGLKNSSNFFVVGFIFYAGYCLLKSSQMLSFFTFSYLLCVLYRSAVGM